MIYELRSYDINPETWDRYVEWGQERAFPVLFEQFRFRLVGFFETLPVEDTEHDTFNHTVGVHWILAWESIEERHQRWAELGASEEWKAVAGEAVDEDGEPLFHMGAQVTIMKAWPGSPIQ